MNSPASSPLSPGSPCASPRHGRTSSPTSQTTLLLLSAVNDSRTVECVDRPRRLCCVGDGWTGRSLRRRVPLPPDQPTALAVHSSCSTSRFPVVHLSSSPYDTLDPRGPASTMSIRCPSCPLACFLVHRPSLRRAALSSAPRPMRRAAP
ncbi:uncharacterized protein BKA78DRAFT_129255 [Phyllosticta capitalensis]|uniref:uncharacterized protein n=1 Tax=Phyllosticta capitalensis TaxID=121624 RepID=UPI00312D12BE